MGNEIKILTETVNAYKAAQNDDTQNPEIIILQKQIESLQEEKQKMVSLEIENEKLSKMNDEITQKMATQNAEKQSLQNALNEYKEAEISQNNLLKEQINSLQLKLNEYENKQEFMDNELKQQHLDEIAEIDAKYKELQIIRGDEKNVTEHRVKRTLELSESIKDIPSLIFNKYKTIDIVDYDEFAEESDFTRCS